jgi:exodeoxyribonuclease-3
VAILSKYPLEDIKTNFEGNPIPDQARFVEVTFKAEIGFCRAICVYMPNGGEVNSDKFQIKIEFYKAFRKYLQSIKSIDEYIIVGGDFNVAPFDIDVYEPSHLQHSTCFTLKERELMRSILNNGWLDLYRIIHPNKEEFSWWDYRSRGFEHNKGMRIDMILGNPKFADIMEDFIMDREVRGQEKSSDHIPIMVSAVL